MIPEDGEDKLNSMDMIGSFPENRIKPSESNDNSVSSKDIENDVFRAQARARKSTL